MYYSSGNYEAFARPKKPADVDNKHAYIIGTGLAALSAACYLVRDGQMPGENIHILEKDPVPGGACDGLDIPGLGYVMRGGREMDNHFEVMWDLFRSIPSIETEGVSVLDEYYWLNKEDPNYSLCRATKNLGKDAGLKGKFGLSDKASMEIMKLFFTPDEDLYDKPITDFFDDEVLNSNFWLYWRTMFAFENWHSALEMKLYIKRYIHHIGGLPDFSALRFTRYNQYESMILPMVKYLESHGVEFRYNTKVENVEFAIGGGAGPKRERTGVGQDTIQKIQATSGFFKRNPASTPTKKLAVRIDVDHEGDKSSIDLTENDLVFITNGGCVENSTMGSQNSPAAWNPDLSLSMLSWSLDHREHPAAIRVPGIGLVSRPDLAPAEDTDYSVARYNAVRQGRDVAVLALGDFFELGERVANRLAAEYGIEATLVNPRFATELDREFLDSLAVEHRVVVTLEDGILDGGWGERVACYLACTPLRARTFGITKGFPDRYDPNELLAQNGMTVENMAAEAVRLLNA